MVRTGLGLVLVAVAGMGGCWGTLSEQGEQEMPEAACSVATSEPPGCDAAEWTRVLSTPGSQSSIAALVGDVERVYAAVHSCDDESSCSTALVALDAQGNELWTRASPGIEALAFASDGGVYGARPTVWGDGGMLARWTVDGAVAWEVAHDNMGVSLDADPQGVYLGGRSSAHTDAGGALGTILPVRADGTVMPEIVLDVHEVSRLRRIPGGFVLVNWGNALVRVDDSGVRAWLTIIDESPGNAHAHVDELTLAGEHVFVVGNPQPPEGQASADVEVFRIALADGAVLERYRIGPRTRPAFSPGLGSRFGVFSNGAAVHLTWGVEKIDVYQPDGMLAWQQTYEGPATASQVALATASDGGFYVAGTGVPDHAERSWWVKRFAGP